MICMHARAQAAQRSLLPILHIQGPGLQTAIIGCAIYISLFFGVYETKSLPELLKIVDLHGNNAVRR